MAECDFCEREMLEDASCLPHYIVVENDDKPDDRYRAVPWGEETRWPTPGESPGDDNRCHDCGVRPGGYHHPGCDIAEDPRDHGQLLGAEFDYYESIPDEIEEQ